MIKNRNEYYKKYWILNIKKKHEYQKRHRQTPNSKYTQYRIGSKRRGYTFNLEFDFFNSLLNQKCSYCGKEKANGIDRINSKIGYEINNVVPCCSICNYMKSTLSNEIFIKHVTSIFQWCGALPHAPKQSPP